MFSTTDKKEDKIIELYECYYEFFVLPFTNPSEYQEYLRQKPELKTLANDFSDIFWQTTYTSSTRLRRPSLIYKASSYGESNDNFVNLVNRYKTALIQDKKKSFLEDATLFRHFLNNNPLIQNFLYKNKRALKKIAQDWCRKTQAITNYRYLDDIREELFKLPCKMQAKEVMESFMGIDVNVSSIYFRHLTNATKNHIYESNLIPIANHMLQSALSKRQETSNHVIDDSFFSRLIKDEMVKFNKYAAPLWSDEYASRFLSALQIAVYNYVKIQINQPHSDASLKSSPTLFATVNTEELYISYLNKIQGKLLTELERKRIPFFIQENPAINDLLKKLINYHRENKNPFMNEILGFINSVIIACKFGSKESIEHIKRAYEQVNKEYPLYEIFSLSHGDAKGSELANQCKEAVERITAEFNEKKYAPEP